MSSKRSRPRGTLVFLTCVLAVPTVSHLLYKTPEGFEIETLSPYLVTGTILGLAHLLLRPLLRLIAAPLGCLTFGLSGTAIDIALIYFSAKLIDGFSVPSFGYALTCALLINFIAAFVGARK